MSNWEPTVIELDSDQWEKAIALKRERAFLLLEQDGLTRQEMEQRYDAYQRKNGRTLHDQKLREEVMDGYLLGWWHGETLLAYASVLESKLLGDKSRLVYNVLDVCVHPMLLPSQGAAIVDALLERVRTAKASSVQLYCPPALYPRVVANGGVSERQCFHWHWQEQTAAF